MDENKEGAASSNEEILLVGDNKRDITTLEGMLKKSGYSCIWKAESADEACNLAKEREFCVIILDVIFLDRNSGLVKKLVRINPSSSILTAAPYNMIDKAITCMEEGAFGYITKPFHESEVSIVTEHAIDHFLLKGVDKEKKHFAKLSVADGLTGLYNVRRFWEVIDEEFRKARQYPSQFSLLMLDIDDFKKYNDTHGHQAGDKLLKDFGSLVKSSLKDEGTGFRYGGEEFVMIVPNTTKREGHLIAERLLGFIRLRLTVTASMGLVNCPEDGIDPKTAEPKVLVELADQRLYKAKKAGKNQICIL